MEQPVGQQTVPLSFLVQKVSESIFLGLKELTEAAPEQSDAERKISLLKFFLKSRQRLLRLLVICKWCRQIPLVERCQQLVGTLSNHDVSFTQAADSLFYLHESLQQSRAPMYDVPSAMDVLLTGTFPRMPKCIEDMASQPRLEGDKKEGVLQKLDTLLRSKLLDIPLPREFTRVTVQNGRITLRVDGEFESQVTLGYRGNASLWRVLNLELLVGESSGRAKFTEMQRLALADDLERRMAALDEPFGIIYTVLHEFCATLVMDTLCRQVYRLMHGRWRDAIRLDSLTTGQQVTGGDGDGEPVSSSKARLKITYWLEFKNLGTESPTLTIEPGSDQQISCQHQPIVLDPSTGHEAEFGVDQSCIDVENLILKAINCNIHSRLAEMQRSLKNNESLCNGENDVVLKSKSSSDTGIGEDMLYVRAYDGFYISVKISVRNGRLMLTAPESLLKKSTLQRMEDALNQGTISPVDAFIKLREKSILQHFATLSSSLNLKVHEKGSISIKPPKNVSPFGPDVLLLGFPNTSNAYLLAVRVDETFVPQFTLVELQPQQQNRSSFASRVVLANRIMNIDISKDVVSKDDMNISLLSEKPSGDLAREMVLRDHEPALPSAPTDQVPVPTDQFPGRFRRQVRPSPFTTRAGFINQPNVLQPGDTSFSRTDYYRADSPLHGDIPSSPTAIEAGITDLIDMISSSPTSTRRPAPLTGPFTHLSETSMVSQDEVRPRKRKLGADVLWDLPSLKRPRTEEEGDTSTWLMNTFVGQSYLNIAEAASRGKASSTSQMAVLQHVVKRCWLNIKTARLTSQMDSLGINYIYESGHLVFRLSTSEDKGDMAEEFNRWRRVHMSLGSMGSDAWEARVRDPTYRDMWNLQKAKAFVSDSESDGVQFTALSEADAHIECGPDGVVLNYNSVEDDSIPKLLSDLDRLRNARAFRLCLTGLLQGPPRPGEHPKWEAIRRSFKVEAVGLASLWFSYTGSMPGVAARFIFEWPHGQKGCSVHVSPELLPHTKYLEEFVNNGEVVQLLDAIRITAGPLHALGGAIRPAKMPTTPPGMKASSTSGSGTPISPAASAQNGQATSAGRNGIVPSSLLPTDISVIMRSPYWIRIVYRKQFSVDMRCLECDNVWLQPATPPQGGKPSDGGSLPCPQFRPFIMENVALGLNSPDTGAGSSQAPAGSASPLPSSPTNGVARANTKGSKASAAQQGVGLGIGVGRSVVPAGVYPGYKGELNSAFCGMSDDGGYGGALVPLVTLKKVLRGMLKYLGVLWLFAQFPGIIKDVLHSVMVNREGHLHLDAEQPALRFNIGNCMFAVNMHRHQLYLQGVNVKRFQSQPQQQQAAAAAAQPAGADSDLTQTEMTEIADFFGRRVACEPYDASRLASFVTILTFPVSVLREFLGLIAWKKEIQKAAQSQTMESSSKPRIELCLENRAVVSSKDDGGPSAKSSILHEREKGNSHDREKPLVEKGFVEFSLTVLLDLANVPHVNVNVAGGAGWLPQCVAVKLRYHYGGDGGNRVVMVNVEGSHGGRACWSRSEDWDKFKEKVASCVEAAAGAGGANGSRLRAIGEGLQLTVQSALQQLRAP